MKTVLEIREKNSLTTDLPLNLKLSRDFPDGSVGMKLCNMLNKACQMSCQSFSVCIIFNVKVSHS